MAELTKEEADSIIAKLRLIQAASVALEVQLVQGNLVAFQQAGDILIETVQGLRDLVNHKEKEGTHGQEAN